MRSRPHGNYLAGHRIDDGKAGTLLIDHQTGLLRATAAPQPATPVCTGKNQEMSFMIGPIPTSR